MFKVSDKIDTHLIATGSHLSKEYGMTIQEIEKDGITVDKRIDILSNDNSEYGISETMSNAIKYFSCLLYTSPSPRDRSVSRMPSSA